MQLISHRDRQDTATPRQFKALLRNKILIPTIEWSKSGSG